MRIKNQITFSPLKGPCAGMWQTSFTARWTAGFSISRQLPDEPLWRAKRVALCLPLVEKTPSCGLSVPFSSYILYMVYTCDTYTCYIDVQSVFLMG